MGEPHLLRHPRGIVDILTSAAGALLAQGHAVVIELQGHADHVIAFFGQQGCRHGRVHAAGHGHHHAGVFRGFIETK